jgi:hypothetical protein
MSVCFYSFPSFFDLRSRLHIIKERKKKKKKKKKKVQDYTSTHELVDEIKKGKERKVCAIFIINCKNASLCTYSITHFLNVDISLMRGRRAGPGVSPASPWARATLHPRATNWEKKIYTIH